MTTKQIIDELNVMLEATGQAAARLGLDEQRTKLTALEKQTARADFWSDPETAEKVSRQVAELKRHISSWAQLEDDISTLLELGKMSNTAEDADLLGQFRDLKLTYSKQMAELLYSGPYDNYPAIVTLSAGVGGTDAQDWAQMLLTMYVKYANSTGLEVAIVETSFGEQAGIKSATLEITGRNAYGKLKGEKGVHRLVRLSPFNADSLRQTSFALVDVIPEIAQTEIDLDDKDLKIDTYRASGHGGQSVNTTDSAVRITHLPTGLVVSIQNERSQLKNKQKALSILASKLSELTRQQHKDSVAELRGKQKSADWGAQIRSYVLHPYNKVKDHRTGYETSDTAAVLGGKLDEFIDAYLKSQINDQTQ